ncbi:MAG: DUF4430 domain-containing protein [Candidatus Korarchaeum sp.]
MGMGERTLKLLATLFLIWALVATFLYLQRSPAPQVSEKIVRVNLGIKYKNGTIEWHNSTSLKEGSTLLDATSKVAVLNYTKYSMGCFVDSINGVRNEHPYYWIWWYWEETTGWTLGPVAADKYVLSDGEVVMWFYEDTTQWPPQRP